MSSHMRSVLATAVIATAALTSACSTTVTGAAAPAGPTTIAPNAANASVRLPALPEGVSIADEAAVPGDFAPGSRIFGVNQEGKGASCTLGPLLADSDAFSAGHCGFTGSPRSLASGARAGSVAEAVDVVPAGKPVLDFSVIDFDVPLPAAPVRVAGRPVSGVLTTKAADSLPVGTLLCFIGAESGVKCGRLVSSDFRGIKVDVPSVDGDSGAAVFMVDGATDTVALVGLLSGDIEGLLGVTYLDAALESAQATALVDAVAAKAVAGNPNYSTRVSSR